MPSQAAVASGIAGVDDSPVLLLSTDQRVYGFELGETKRITMGRREDNDLRFTYRNVSGEHAVIVVEDDHPVLRDLNSTNGTYLNGERVREQRLRDGDLIRIGRYDIQVMLSGGGDRGTGSRSKSMGEAAGMFLQSSIPDDGSSESLRDALIRISSTGKTCAVTLFGPGEEITLFLWHGKIVHADGDEVSGDQAVFRAFEWMKGTFRVSDLPDDVSLPRSVTLPSPKIIEVGAEQAAEMHELRERLPMPHMRLELCVDSRARICDLSPGEYEVFQAIIRVRTLARALKECPLPDLHTLRAAHALLQRGVFEVSHKTGSQDQTVAPDQTQEA